MGAAKFAPLGWRGMFGGRQSFGVPDYVHRANEQTMVIVLIEETAALDNLDDILKVDGVDVFFVAPSDLSQTMGHIGNPGHPEVQAAIDDAIARIVDAGRTAGTLVNDENAAAYVAKRRPVSDDLVERVGGPRRRRFPGPAGLGGVDKFRFRQEDCRNCLASFRRRFRGQSRQLIRTKTAAKALDSGLRRNDGLKVSE